MNRSSTFPVAMADAVGVGFLRCFWSNKKGLLTLSNASVSVGRVVGVMKDGNERFSGVSWTENGNIN